ncbi:MAG: sigma-54-dependent Fis family transcriptional regulator [FCB group bacterium]|nr:sigma-54-dependent Fis family transcriptional regulator [FCB group bacterium]
MLITGYADIEVAVRAINEGQVFHYLNKPWEPEDLVIIMKRAVEHYRLVQENRRLLRELEVANQQLTGENRVLKQEIEKHYHFEHIIGRSPAMRKVIELVKKIIPTDTTVLLQGETGTGKELIARAIHYNGPRQKKLFVAQNCAALPDTLLESELFGHKKGAFTDASADKKGLFALADGGTIFLDEIGDTSPAMQQRLLRVLQEGEIHPLGSTRTVRVDVRIISATNRDLYGAVRRGEFREDLFYRLNVFPITLPPLRDRREDIPPLVNHFVRKYAMKMGKQIRGVSAEAMAVLVGRNYPGNVRELENMVERAVVLADDGNEITVESLRSEARSETVWTGAVPGAPLGTLKETTAALEKQLITQALEETGGNISQAANLLGLSRLGLYKKIERLGVKVTR